MQKYTVLAHTSDTGISARGRDLPEAYANAAAGMFSIITDLRGIKTTETRRVEVTEDNPEALLFEWLNSLLYYFDVETLIFKRFDILEFSDTHLTALCHGEKYDSARHRLHTAVKSATYHMLEVDRVRHCVRVFFDV